MLKFHKLEICLDVGNSVATTVFHQSLLTGPTVSMLLATVEVQGVFLLTGGA